MKSSESPAGYVKGHSISDVSISRGEGEVTTYPFYPSGLIFYHRPSAVINMFPRNTVSVLRN